MSHPLTTPNPRNGRVLLVDRDEALGAIFRSELAVAGFELDMASTAFEGIEFLSERPYDALILEIILPGPLNGFSVVSFVETEKPELLDQVYVISGIPEQTIMHAVPALLPRFFRKPFNEKEVAGTIAQRIGATPEHRREKERVLVADDDEISRRLVAHLVRETGRDVVEVSDGHAAIRELGQEHFASVILDLMMPHVDGFDVLRYLQKTNAGMLPRTIVLSGMPEHDRDGHLLEGVRLMLGKPADVARLREAIGDLCG